MVESLYEVVGEAGIRRLVSGFYARVQEDDILRPMYPEDDWEGAEARLASFLIFRLGGPRDYLSERGHPRLRMRHAPFAIDLAARDRWVALMGASFDEAGWPPLAEAQGRAFLGEVASFLINRAPGPAP